MRRPTDGSHLGDAGGESSPALGAGSGASAMDATKRWDADQRKEDFATPLPGAPNIGYRVPAKPLRFEHWGAHEDFSLPKLALSLVVIPKLDR